MSLFCRVLSDIRWRCRIYTGAMASPSAALLTEDEVRPKIDRITNEIFDNVPSGLGTKGKLKVSDRELTEVVVKGSKWAVDRGYGEPDDVKTTEEYGCIKGADPETVSSRARERGL